MSHTVLLIEDDQSNVELIQHITTRLKRNLVHSVDGNNLFDLLSQHDVSLILLDMRLPNGSNGWDIAQALRSSPQYGHLPIVAVSVPVTADDEMLALEAGCRNFIAKPFTFTHLKECIERYS
jgi:CheY-like chemotaxis protein